MLLCSQQVAYNCNLMDCILPGSSVQGIFQTRILKLVVISFSRDLPNPRMEPTSLASPALAGVFFSTEPPGKPNKSHRQLIRTDMYFSFLEAGYSRFGCQHEWVRTFFQVADFQLPLASSHGSKRVKVVSGLPFQSVQFSFSVVSNSL